MKATILITDGLNTQQRTLKQGTTLEQAMTRLQQLYDNDYMDLSYSLYIDNVLYCELEY